MDPLAAIKVTFFQECEEQLAELESGLLAMEAGDTDPETINAVFRAAHTIKGGAGIVECDYIVGFTHVLENALDDARDGRIKVDHELIQLLLASGDQIARLLDERRLDREWYIEQVIRQLADALAAGERAHAAFASAKALVRAIFASASAFERE